MFGGKFYFDKHDKFIQVWIKGLRETSFFMLKLIIEGKFRHLELSTCNENTKKWSQVSKSLNVVLSTLKFKKYKTTRS